MTRLRGRSLRGKRLHAAAPCGRWRSTTMISSIRLEGTTACMTIAGATDTEVFRTYVAEVLCPELRPGDIVIMDNLGAHKSPAPLELITAKGAQALFLPAYCLRLSPLRSGSPDLNPIEKMWSKVKADLRRAAARTPEDLDEAIGAALAKVTANDARGWFNSCGYSFI